MLSIDVGKDKKQSRASDNCSILRGQNYYLQNKGRFIWLYGIYSSSIIICIVLCLCDYDNKTNNY